MVYHLAGNPTEFDWAPAWLDYVLSFGFLGVPTFFAISGFVIAQNTNSANLSGRYFGIFAAKRSIRLDPQYRARLLISLAMLTIKSLFFRPKPRYFQQLRALLPMSFACKNIPAPRQRAR